MHHSKNNSEPLDPEAMTNEFTDICTHYYKLYTRFIKRKERLYALEENAPVYKHDKSKWVTNLAEIDAIMKYYYNGQAKRAELEKIEKQLRLVEKDIQYLMQFFGIPAWYPLRGQIPGELEYEVFAIDNGQIHIIKIADLEPEVLPDDIIEIRTSFWKDEEEDED